jgi:hypothetical protein
MDDRLYDLLLKLPRKNLIHLMWDALDEMQAYNGRSKTHCVATAMGLKPDNSEPTKWKVTSLAEIKRHTENLSPW